MNYVLSASRSKERLCPLIRAILDRAGRQAPASTTRHDPGRRTGERSPDESGIGDGDGVGGKEGVSSESGISIVEVIIAMVLIVGMVLASSQLLIGTGNASSDARQREAAANLASQLSAQYQEQLSTELVATFDAQFPTTGTVATLQHGSSDVGNMSFGVAVTAQYCAETDVVNGSPQSAAYTIVEILTKVQWPFEGTTHDVSVQSLVPYPPTAAPPAPLPGGLPAC